MLEVSVKQVSFSYDKDLILANINMKVEAGAFVCLLGQSGCGKSTFLRLAYPIDPEKLNKMLRSS